MTVKLEHWGWHRAPDNLTWLLPNGYHRYLAVAANGIVVFIHTPAGESVIPDGEYELADKDWSLDNPKWEQLEERDYIWEMD